MEKEDGRRKKGFRRSVCLMVPSVQQKFIGMKRTESAGKRSRSSGLSPTIRKRDYRFVICVRNDENPVSLEVRKLYQVIPDSKASEHHLVRIVDESGDDYLYPEDYFVAIKLPQAV